MSLIKQPDGHGHSITYIDTDGYLTATFGLQAEVLAARFRSLPKFKCRQDDVFLCAPPKSGTHWLWEIISMMYAGNAKTIQKSKIETMLEPTPAEILEKAPSPRLLNTHVHNKYMPKQIKELGCKIVHLLRNPKDLAVSLYNHTCGIHLFEYHGEWEHFLPLFLQGKTECNSWFDYVLGWEHVMSDNPDLPIHLIYFEDLKKNTLQEMYRLGQFLGIEDKDGVFEDIANKCQFSNMVKDKQIHNGIESGFIRDGFSYFRKGEIGDWKNWFTVEQNETFDKIYKEKMVGTKHKFIYDYIEDICFLQCEIEKYHHR